MVISSHRATGLELPATVNLMPPSRRRPPRMTPFRLGEDEYVVLTVPQPKASLAALTNAERDVVEHILASRSNAEIASRRDSSVRTVANQIASIFRKLEVSSRAELVAHLVTSKSSEE